MTEAKEVLHQILGVPGAIGALVFSTEGEVLASDFPDHYSAGTIQNMVQLLSEDFLVQQALEGEGGGLDLRFNGGRVILRPVPKGAILALCSGSVNAQLMNLALLQAAHRLEKAPPTAPAAASPRKPPAVTVATTRSVVLGQLKLAFLGSIGPIGEFLFSRIHADWSVGADPRNLREFANLLAQELDDPSDRKVFIQEANAIIG
jgi:predicted regulator of Ras-like GTPase activity (Roadblock/LC7/MglB family)